MGRAEEDPVTGDTGGEPDPPTRGHSLLGRFVLEVRPRIGRCRGPDRPGTGSFFPGSGAAGQPGPLRSGFSALVRPVVRGGGEAAGADTRDLSYSRDRLRTQRLSYFLVVRTIAPQLPHPHRAVLSGHLEPHTQLHGPALG